MSAYNISQTPASTSFSVGANELDLTRLQVPAAGTITDITFYAHSTQMVGMPVIYSSSGSMGTTGSRLWYGTEVTVPANSSLTVTANHAIGSAQEIWVGFHNKLAGRSMGYARGDKNASNVTTNCTYFTTSAYGTPPSGPLGAAANYANAVALRVLFQPTTDTDRGTLSGATDVAVGSAGWGVAADTISLRKVTLASAVSVNKLRIWCVRYGLNVSVKPVIYSDSSNYPGTLLATGSVVSGLYPGGNDLAFSPDVSLSAGDYWVGYIPNVAMTFEANSGTVAATRYQTSAGSYTTPPTPAPGAMTLSTSDTPAVGLSGGAAGRRHRRVFVMT
jgi:hypothetical protein